MRTTLRRSARPIDGQARSCRFSLDEFVRLAEINIVRSATAQHGRCADRRDTRAILPATRCIVTPNSHEPPMSCRVCFFIEMIEVYGNKSIAGPVILIDTGKHRYLSSTAKLRGSGRVRSSRPCRQVRLKGKETLMGVYSFGDPSLGSVRARLRAIVLNLQTALWGGSVRQYRPEAHYMRGPGPKWRERHGSKGQDTGFPQRP